MKHRYGKLKGRGVKITHYRDKCIGCGMCTLACPQNWKLSKVDGKAILLGSKIDIGTKRKLFRGEVDPIDYEDNKKAADNCPVKIIDIAPI